MAGYNEIRGLRVKYLSADPSNAEDGQVWYNSTTGNLRVQGIGVGAWASASPLITGRQGLAGGGTQTACAFWGGSGPTNSTEEYNGSGFSTGGNLPYSAVYLAGCGTQTAGLACGGDPGPTQVATACTYDGASWTGIPSLNTARSRIGATGTTSAALAFGGGNPWGINNSEEYSGSSWAEGNNLNTARRVNNSGGGPQTAGIVAGGDTGPPSAPSAHTEEYDGTNWTSGGNLSTGLYLISGCGTQTAALGFGGNLGTTTEEYNGTSWTSGGALNLGRSRAAAGGTQTAAAGFGGERNPSPGATNATEHYDGSSWVTSANMATARLFTSGGKSAAQTSSLCVGGGTPPASNATEEFTAETTALNIKTITTS